MGLSVYTYSRPEEAIPLLCKSIRRLPSVFSPVWILTGHQQTNDWLTEAMARELNISGHVYFQEPLDFVSMVHHILEAGRPRSEWLKQEVITWLIDDALASADADKLTQYFAGKPLKQFALSVEMAALFEQYQTDSPALIRSWKAGQPVPGNAEDSNWQWAIWNKLKALAGDRFADLPSLYDQIREALKDEQKVAVLKAKVPQLHGFGGLAYTPDFVQLLDQLSQHIEVNIFRHDLIAPGAGHEVTARLATYAAHEHRLFERFTATPITQESAPPSDPNLLQQVQARLRGEKLPARAIEAGDDSISIHAHYTIDREVEGLYHYLIRQFEQDPTLGQREVCVVCPDLKRYAPAIKTWFERDPFKIACTFYDTGHRFHQSPYPALEALLRLEADEFTSSKVISLLDFSYIREKFGLTEDISLLKRMLNEANIRHGFAGDPGKETHLVSWQYGFKRLLYGACLKPGITQPVHFAGADFTPVDSFEGTEVDQMVRLYQLVSTVHRWLESREASRTLEEWVAFTAAQTVEVFLEIKAYDPLKFNRILESLSVAHSFLPEKKVDFSTYRQYMLSALARMEPSEKSGFGGVRFIAPSAYLSAPARLYAFLGMNGEVFPRNSHRLSFDLSDPALPQKADYDRHLFLNFLLAPRDKVFISYLGRNVKNNDSIPPSALLEELWTVVRGFLPSVKELKDFTVHHPLHRFSQQYADPANRLVRYVENKPDTQRIWKEKASEDRRKIWEKDDRGRIVIPLEQLVRFVEDPVRHYYNRVLRVYYFDREKETEERELFSLGNLDGWAVKDQILTDRLMGNQHPNRLRLELKQKGVLPLKHLGEVGYEDANEAVNEVIAAVGELVHHRPVTIDLELPIGDRYVIQGKIASVYEDLSKYLFVTTSNDKPKYQIRALVHHQLLQLDGRWPNMELRYVAKKDGRSINLPGDLEFIQAICDKMLEGTERLIPFSIHCLNKFELGNQASLQEQAILRLEDPNDGYSFSEYFGNIVKKELLDNEESQRDFEAMFHLTKRMIDQYFSKK